MTEAKPGDVVELANKDVGFTDPDTLFDISRAEQKELTDPVGSRTQAAIACGAILIVKTKKPATKKASKDAETEEAPAE